MSTYRVPPDRSQTDHVEGLPFGTRGGMLVRHEFPADGEYALKVWPVNLGNMDNNQAFGGISGEKLEFLLDGEQLHVYDWDRELRAGAAIHGGTPDFRFKATAGEHAVGITFLAQNYSPNINDLNKHFLRSTIETGGIAGFTFYPHVGYIRIDGPFDAKPAGASASRNKVLICKPSAEKEEAACAKRIIENLARNAYRRPATDRDVERLMGFYQQARNSGGNFEKGVELAIQSVLMDPSFLFRKEEEPTSVAAGAKYRVSDTELASRLSFFLWSSIPDNELLTLASQNKLRDPKTLDAQVKRMLADPKSQAFVKNFFGQWLQIRGLHGMSPEPKLFPDFDDNLRQALVTIPPNTPNGDERKGELTAQFESSRAVLEAKLGEIQRGVKIGPAERLVQDSVGAEDTGELQDRVGGEVIAAAGNGDDPNIRIVAAHQAYQFQPIDVG